MISVKQYIVDNLIKGLKTPPTNLSVKSVILIPFYIIFALSVGFYFDVLKFKPIYSSALFYLPITLLFMPAIFEEVIFRGLIIPRDTKNKDTKTIIAYIAISTILYLLWHPLMGLINPVSAVFFFNPYFLIIVVFLGITCGLAYIYSQSLWLPIIIHWLTVLIWVILLGGRNLILDS